MYIHTQHTHTTHTHNTHTTHTYSRVRSSESTPAASNITPNCSVCRYIYEHTHTLMYIHTQHTHTTHTQHTHNTHTTHTYSRVRSSESTPAASNITPNCSVCIYIYEHTHTHSCTYTHNIHTHTQHTHNTHTTHTYSRVRSSESTPAASNITPNCRMSTSPGTPMLLGGPGCSA